jgi:sarcosine oxidase subunit beta
MSKHIIVGGGVYGAAVAWHLASRGEAVELIEAGTIASGASGGPGRRGVRANGRDYREIPLMVRARELWPGLHESLGTAPLYETTGQIQLFEREIDLAPAEARAVLQNRLGIESRVWRPSFAAASTARETVSPSTRPPRSAMPKRRVRQGRSSARVSRRRGL